MATTTRAPRRDATENREALLRAAKTVLNREPDASLDAIAAEAGLTRRAVYGHFASRDELLGELVALGTRRVADAVGAVDDADPMVRIALIGAVLWHEVEHVRVMADVVVRGPLRDRVAHALTPLRRRLADAVRAAQDSGAARDDIPAETLARLIEHSAVAVLRESARTDLAGAEGHRLVLLSALGLLGLDAASAVRFVAERPELAYRDRA